MNRQHAGLIGSIKYDEMNLRRLVNLERNESYKGRIVNFPMISRGSYQGAERVLGTGD